MQIFDFVQNLVQLLLLEFLIQFIHKKSGYFKYKVQAYGTPLDQSEYYIKAYTDEEAKSIGNYTVYGLRGLKEVATVVPISQIL